MAETLIYTNSFDEPINKRQILQINEYHKIFLENDIVKKIELFEEGKITGIYHYLESGEIEIDIVNQLSPLVTSFIEIRERVSHGSNYLIQERYYLNKILEAKSNTVLDSNGNEIGNEYINLVTGLADKNETEKHLYNQNDELILSFDYNSDGTLNYIWGDLVMEENIFKDNFTHTQEEVIYQDKIQDYFPDLLNDNPYYVNADL